ncbi:MAG TPA: hypothetical protein PK304_03360 [Mobilitalea sp.]|nr:hypothetical protein [Mobilitalea sp.]
MYYFRALNKYDLDNYSQNKSIVAKERINTNDVNEAKKCITKIIQHILNGSDNQYRGCWISACKSFEVCVKEFSVPQMGNYNTAKTRKKIAVIEGEDYYGNLTYLEGKVNDKSVKLNTSGSYQEWLNIWDQLSSISKFIIDFSYRYTHKKTKFKEYSFGDWVKAGFIRTLEGEECDGVPGIPSGNVKKASEVLILNEIPFESIKKVLSFLEIDILYALNKNDFNMILKDIIDGNINITFNNKNINLCVNKKNEIVVLNNDEKELYKQLYIDDKFMIDLVYDIYINKQGNIDLDSVLNIFNDFKELKRNIIKKIIKALNKESNNKIVEDELYIAILNKPSPDETSSDCNILTKCIYDLLMIGDKEKNALIKYNDSNYSNILKECIDIPLKIMESGKTTFCKFLKFKQ